MRPNHGAGLPLRVLSLNHGPIGLGRGNTDLAYMSRLVGLGRYAPIDVCVPESTLSNAIETWRFVDRALRHRLRCLPAPGAGFLAPLQERALHARRRRLGWDVLYTNACVPRGDDLGPVVMFDYIHAPAETEDPNAFARDVATKTAVAERCAAVQVSTESQRNLFRRLGIAADRLHVVPFFMADLVSAEREAVRAKQVAHGALQIAFVGHQARRKGLSALLQALQDPLLAHVPLRLTIVSRFLDGDVPLPQDPRICHHAVLPHAEVLRLLATAQVLAVPSRRETFGLVYMEGMAAGCVCVMAAGPQQYDISEGGRCGLPVGPNPQALAGTLLRLHEDAEARTALALAGLRRFHETYAPARVAAEYAKMFEAARARA